MENSGLEDCPGLNTILTYLKHEDVAKMNVSKKMRTRVSSIRHSLDKAVISTVTLTQYTADYVAVDVNALQYLSYNVESSSAQPFDKAMCTLETFTIRMTSLEELLMFIFSRGDPQRLSLVNVEDVHVETLSSVMKRCRTKGESLIVECPTLNNVNAKLLASGEYARKSVETRSAADDLSFTKPITSTEFSILTGGEEIQLKTGQLSRITVEQYFLSSTFAEMADITHLMMLWLAGENSIKHLEVSVTDLQEDSWTRILAEAAGPASILSHIPLTLQRSDHNPLEITFADIIKFTGRSYAPNP